MSMKMPTRQPIVQDRRLRLGEQDAERQIARGVYVIERGQRFPIPVDRVRELYEHGADKHPDSLVYLDRTMWRQDEDGRVFKPDVVWRPTRFDVQRKVLSWLRDNVNRNIPHLYYLATLGHDVHVTSWGELYGRHWHQGWANPFNPDDLVGPIDPTFETWFKTHYVSGHVDCRLGLKCPARLGVTLADLQSRLGFIEDLGFLSGNKVTDAFISETIDELVSATGSEFADFDFHEVGTSSTAESNDDTALVATSGIARATGTPTDNDPIYTTVATITADATESWEEHAVFNNSSGAAMMDRNLTGGQSVNSSDQVQYTYNHTQNPEA